MDSLSPLTATGQTLSLHDVASSDSPLIVHIDFKSPYAFLAIEPTRQMLKSLGVVAAIWAPRSWLRAARSQLKAAPKSSGPV
jgi:hypothetical protein